MNLNLDFRKHKKLCVLQLTLTRCGVWISIGPFTFRIRNDSRKVGQPMPVEFSVGFGAIYNRPFMEIGKTAFDVSDGVIVVDQMY